MYRKKSKSKKDEKSSARKSIRCHTKRQTPPSRRAGHVVRRPRMQVDLMPNQTAPSSCDGAARGDKRGPAACEPPPSPCDGAARGDKRGPAACELCGCGAFARRTSVQLELGLSIFVAAKMESECER